MKYELAKKLKDAGFPQKGLEGYKQGTNVELDNHVYTPTLSEIIKALGDKFDRLERLEDSFEGKQGIWWRAYPTSKAFETMDSHGECPIMECCGYEAGDDPEEAMTRLYIALNEPR